MESAAALWRQLPDLLATTCIATDDLGELGERLGYLDDSCERYDARVRSEHQPLAAAILALVHDSDTTAGLLSRIGLRSALPWADGTLEGDPLWVRDSVTTGPIPVVSMLTVVRAQGRSSDEFGEARLAPAFTSARLGDHWVTFHSWWEQPRIYSFPDVAITRRDLVLHLANDDGAGALLTDARPLESQAISRLGSAGSLLPDRPGSSIHDDSLVSAAIRQIAEEVRFTLRATLHEVLDARVEAGGVPRGEPVEAPAGA
jgi:hypothetical protein